MGDKLVNVICLNHHEQLVQRLWNFFQTKNLVDYDLQCGGGSIRAHQLMVEVFLSTEQQPRHVSLNQNSNTQQLNSQHNNLECLLEFLYTGQVKVPEKQLDTLLDLARELNFQMLIDAAGCAKMGKNGPPEMKTRSAGRVLGRQRKGNPAKILKKNESLDDSRLSGDGESGQLTTVRQTRQSKRAVGLAATRGRRTQRVQSAESADEVWSSRDDQRSPDLASGGEGGGGCYDSSESWEKGTEPAAAKRRTVAKRKTSCKRKTTCKRKPKTAAADKEMQVYECQHCDYKTRNRAWLPIHMSKHDPSIAVFRCGSCYRQYLTEDALQHHKEVSHAGDPEVFECPHCDYKARNKNWFQVHLAKHDPSVEIFRCDLCDKAFFSQESVERHKSNHKQYKCPQCPFETPKALSFYQHRFTVHEVDGKGRPLIKLNCSECKFTCKKRSELKYHVLAMHSGTKPFQCPQCPYTTGRKSEVNRHIKVAHLDLKPHLCDTCGFRTVSQSALDLHQRSHTGEKPYNCKICGQKFGQASKLSKHERRHVVDERPFVCHVCGSAFNRRCHLKVHLKNVHKLVPELI